MERQAASLRKVRDEGGKPVVVAIRPATTDEGFEHSLHFQEACWKNGLATYPSIARAGRALARLLEWQRMRDA
jgi:hypothetical protein